MPLRDRSRMPPGGFFYREPAINWQVPNPFLPFDMIVEQIQRARANNPASGLDPRLGACARALDDYTCTRLGPEWCHDNKKLAIIAEENAKPRKCTTCGNKRGGQRSVKRK